MSERGAAEPDPTERNLAPTEFIDWDAPSIRERAGALGRSAARETAIALFDWVRDAIRYDPYSAMAERDAYRASAVLASGRGYCVQKAVLLALIGVQFVATGVLGELLTRIYHEPEGRPQYVLRSAPRARRRARSADGASRTAG